MIILRGLRMGGGFSFGPVSCDGWPVTCDRWCMSCDCWPVSCGCCPVSRFLFVLTRSGALRGRFFCRFLLFNERHETKSHGTGSDGCGEDHANCLDEL